MPEVDIEHWFRASEIIASRKDKIHNRVNTLIADDKQEFDKIPCIVELGKSHWAVRGYRFPADVGPDGVPVGVKDGTRQEAYAGMQHLLERWAEICRQLLTDMDGIIQEQYVKHVDSPKKLYDVGKAWEDASNLGRPIAPEVAHMKGGTWEGKAADSYRDIIPPQADATAQVADLTATTGNVLFNGSAALQGLYLSCLAVLDQAGNRLNSLDSKGQAVGERTRAAIPLLRLLNKTLGETLLAKDAQWRQGVTKGMTLIETEGILGGSLKDQKWPTTEGREFAGVRAKGGQPPTPPPEAGERESSPAPAPVNPGEVSAQPLEAGPIAGATPEVQSSIAPLQPR